jgi:uncharacterized repeat protein (TIGR01451 family)
VDRQARYRFLVISIVGFLFFATFAGSSTQQVYAQAAQTSSDISIHMTVDRGSVGMGQDVTYTVSMTNLGPEDATFVDVGFKLPDQLVLVSMECDLGISADTPFCEYSSLPAGVTVVSTLTATPNPAGRLLPRMVTTSASVYFESDTVDTHTVNNNASVRTRIVRTNP